ncbi:hypothetical protein CSIM01_05133 [Colletotrichum simmondsii]|uniref:FAD-binding PCMH-type domain-containing protein n=1 Tax=Colletotrichum simmondsii TaxID=703756 RepID=A0A135SIJ1_9PEZI|nr:hypothetical protein CSIM01_05133 [Colletotrichum simmondsii]
MRCHIPLHLAAAAACALAAEQSCKCVLGDTCWPTEDQWAALNKTISGQLIKAVPPGAVCYPSRAEFDAVACDALLKQWSSSSFHSSHPFSIQGPLQANDSCNPIHPNGTSITGDTLAGSKECSQGSFPLYVVNATETSHIAEAVKFAQGHDMRLIVKNTGHAGSEKNTAHNSLSVWTHNFKNITFHKQFQPQSGNVSNSTLDMAVTMGAGVQAGELHATNAKNNVMAVSGTNLDVGIAGWSSGGGHGYNTGEYGMGADNILEATVVTPSGDIVTANAHDNQDLFWAIRGGGGSTYGILTSMTVRVYPSPRVTLWSFDLSSKNGTTAQEWWQTIAALHKRLPQAHERGVQGYYSITGPPSSAGLALHGVLFGWDLANGTMRNIVAPLQELLDQSSSTAYIQAKTSFVNFPSFFQMMQALPSSERAGTTRSQIASRLLSREVLTDKQDDLAKTLEIIGPSMEAPKDGFPNVEISGTLTASWKPVNNSLNPVWRNTALHLVAKQSWDDSDAPDAVNTVVDRMVYTSLEALRELDPTSGAYLNEVSHFTPALPLVLYHDHHFCSQQSQASTFEPGWQASFFGVNYPRLRSIKARYDPTDLFWCPTCVGSEGWVQQEDGILCRAFQLL